MGIAAFAAAEGDRNHLAAFGVVAEAGRVRHANEFVFDERFALVNFERLRHDARSFAGSVR